MTTLSIAAQLAKLKKEREAIERKEKALLSKTNEQAMAQIKAIMKESGLSVEDLLQGLKLAKAQKIKMSSSPKRSTGVKAGFKVPIKYRHPQKTNLEWTGRGKTPLWIQELKAKGQLEQALVT